MEKLITLFFFGVLLILIGISNRKGDISSIHWYNRRNIAEHDRMRYGKCMGLGSMIIGFSLILAAVLEILFETSIFDVIILIGCILGLAVMLYGQFKYNKGIF